MIPNLLSAFPHRQFHTLPGLLDSWAALPNSYPNALRAMQGGSLHHFYDGLLYYLAERRAHDLPRERRTRYRLSQPDTIYTVCIHINLPQEFSQQTTVRKNLKSIESVKQFAFYSENPKSNFAKMLPSGQVDRGDQPTEHIAPFTGSACINTNNQGKSITCQ